MATGSNWSEAEWLARRTDDELMAELEELVETAERYNLTGPDHFASVEEAAEFLLDAVKPLEVEVARRRSLR